MSQHGQQERAAALLRQAAELLQRPAAATATTSATGSSTFSITPPVGDMTTVPVVARSLFGPYRRNRNTSRRGGRGERLAAPVSYWTHKFCIVPRCTQETVPSREEKFRLHSAGLGEKKLTIVKNASPADFSTHLEAAYPKLRDCGGYELLRTPPGSRVSLEVLLIPPGGFTSAHLADESCLQQAVCYIRPIQKDLDMGTLSAEAGEQPCEECLNCGDKVPITLLRDHVDSCQDGVTYAPLEKIRRTSVQTPLCQFACVSGSSSNTEIKEDSSKQKKTGVCPVCQEVIDTDLLETHAAGCGEDSLSPKEKQSDVVHTFDEDVQEKLLELEQIDGNWTLNIVRRFFMQTAIDELENSLPADWNKCLNIKFIGEDGVDGGGLTREFFSLLFEKTSVFEEEGFSYDSDLMEKKRYHLLGKVTAMSVIHRHPGPRRLNKLFVDYILKGIEPNKDTPDTYIRDAEVIMAIEEITSATDENINEVFDKYSHLLNSTGYKKLLSIKNRDGAISALKSFYSFYRFMAPMLQFMEGLKQHGVLALLQNYEENGRAVLGKEKNQPSCTDVLNFYMPKFSEDNKETEEMIIFNFSKFLKNVEHGSVSTPWITIEDNQDEEKIVKLNMGHVLQALIGCKTLTKIMSTGTIDFCHLSDQFSYVNTCAPSLCFCRTSELVTYEKLENHLIRIVVEAEGFGLM